jgi:putative Holliday junction resolvase
MHVKEHMAKLLSLDLGDQWTGIAVSDPLGILARPLKTVKTEDLHKELSVLLDQERVKKVIVGYPQTLKGTESQQTKKTIEYKEKLEEAFKNIQFVLWDERLSSKRAEKKYDPKNKQDKIMAHARAAAYILDSYLIFVLHTK